jgi:hypothetical protein
MQWRNMKHNCRSHTWPTSKHSLGNESEGGINQVTALYCGPNGSSKWAPHKSTATTAPSAEQVPMICILILCYLVLSRTASETVFWHKGEQPSCSTSITLCHVHSHTVSAACQCGWLLIYSYIWSDSQLSTQSSNNQTFNPPVRWTISRSFCQR